MKELKPEDLRLNNLVKEKYSGEVIKVEEITTDSVTFSGFFIDKWKAEPIPLTGELLLKSEFSNKDYGYHIAIDRLRVLRLVISNGKFYAQIEQLTTYGNGENEVSIVDLNLEIKSYHQLQNLYHTLTSEELKLKEE
jgi:hypothetical protein